MSAPCARLPWGLGLAQLLLVTGILTACGRDDRLNVYLVTLDTTRADHLGCYGHEGIETPHIDRLAAAGTRYDNAFTPVPITLPAHTSIMTGTYPVYHGVRVNSGFYVPDEMLTLAEILRGEGYDTAAVVGAFPLDSQTGIDQGFDLYDDNYPSSLEQGRHPLLRRFFDERPAAEVSRAALAWLGERRQRPFFLWTHYFDPHQPRSPPSPYRERYAAMPYDGEIASVDEAVGQILLQLEKDGLLKRTLVVLSADHGEGLGDHGEATHALLLYSSTLRVPLIVRDPGHPGAAAVTTPVSTVDIFPTILKRLGLDVPAASQGLELPRSDTEVDAEREIYSETLYGRLFYGWSPLDRLTADSRVVIRGPRLELYDRSFDAGEENDLSTAQSLALTALARRLARRKSALADGGHRFSRGRASDQARARLAALGYLSDGSGTDPGADGIDATRPDPASTMEVFNLDMEAGTHLDARRFELAVPVLERAEKLDPANPALLKSLAQAHLGMGALERARRALDKLLGIAPEHVAAHLLLARYHQTRGEVVQALALLERAVELDPADVSTRLLLAHQLEDAGELAAAESAYRALLDTQGDHTLAMNGLAALLHRRGETAAAVELLETLLKAQPFFAPACLNLGVIEHGRGLHQRSLQLAERALELRPGYPQALELKRRNLEALAEAPPRN